ncbi:ATP-dependent DNA helicase [Aquifex pyrophilus]
MKPQDFYEYLLKKGFEERKSQRKMIDLVEETIENEEVSLIEAPTGTGKTFAYLIPLIVKGQKAIISTGTKILQDQLKRDIEFLSAHWKLLTGKEVNYAILKGKENYLCIDRFKKEDIETADRLEIESLMETEWDGDLTLTNVSPETAEKVSVDDDYCTFAYRMTCPYFWDCYYWSRLKRREADADILVVNHSLLALRDFDTRDRVLVIDEAHELDRYLTHATRSGITLYWFKELEQGLGKLLEEEVKLGAEEFFINNFGNEFSEEETEKPLKNPEFYAPLLKDSLYIPLKSYLNKLREKVKKELEKAIRERLMVSIDFKEFLERTYILPKEVLDRVNAGYEEPNEEERRLIDLVKKLNYYERKLTKLRDFIELMMENRKDFGFKVARKWSRKLKNYNYRIEAFKIFPRNILDPEDYKAVILTSATVDPEDIYLTTGITGNYYVLEHNYDYTNSTIVIENTNPKREDWKNKLKQSFYILTDKYDKVLVLLTNKEHLKLFEGEGKKVGIQGRESLTILLEELRRGSIKALVGLDSLWTGVDVKGEKGILMAKLPFENPSDPLTHFRLNYLKSIGEDPFLYQRRKAYIKFRQGVGRLVRQHSDKGTIILCDNRIWRYREFIDFLRSLGINLIYKGKFKRSFFY